MEIGVKFVILWCFLAMFVV